MTNKQLTQIVQLIKEEIKEQIREELQDEILYIVNFIKEQEQKLVGKNINNVIEQLDKERQG